MPIVSCYHIYQLLLRLIMVAKYSNEYVCLSVCLSVCLCVRTQLENPTAELNRIFCMLPMPWLDPPLTALWYVIVMYFRFYGWRHCHAIKQDVMFMRSFPRGGRPISLARATGQSASSQAVLLPRRPRTRGVGRAIGAPVDSGSSQRLRKQSAVMTLAKLPLRSGHVAACVEN